MSLMEDMSTDRRRHRRIFIATMLLIATLLLAGAGTMLSGSVDIPAIDVVRALTGGVVGKSTWRSIVLETRVPMVLTSAVAGSALSMAGLLLQTCFKNPLAGPSILGISTGASLGVAIVVLAGAGSIIGGAGQYVGIMGGALGGAAVVLLLLTLLSRFVSSNVLLLIAGILVGYFASSAISLLNFYATHDSVYAFTVWGLGSFSGGSLGRSLTFCAITIPLILVSMLFVKPLNALLLGERYAESVGIKTSRTRFFLLLASGGLTASVTAFCGPIGFIGLIVPHLARMIMQTSNHNILLPTTALCGGATGLLCAWISVAAGQTGIIPINAITPIIGVPIVMYVMLNRKRLLYFE